MPFALRPTIPCLCLIRRGSVNATIAVEFVDGSGRTVAATDLGDPFVVLTISSTARSLGYHVDAAGGLTGTQRPGLPNAAVGAVVTVLTGEVNLNMAGTVDGLAGAGAGLTASTLAPTTSTNMPDYASAGTRLYVGDIDRTAR